MKIGLTPLTSPLVFVVTIVVLTLCSCSYQSDADEQATAQAEALIESLSLRESAEPIREHGRWAPPRRVAVILPNSIRRALPNIVERLTQVAGGAELVVIESGQPKAADFEGVDVLFGACSAKLAAQTSLRWIHSYPVGVERCIPALRAMEMPPILTNGQRLSGPQIAEHVIAVMMALKTNLHRYYRQQLEGQWRAYVPSAGLKAEISGSTMLVAGLGGIGTQVARRAAGLGMRVIATRNSSREGPEFVDYVGLAGEMHELAGQADVIVNALPLTADTERLFDAKFFAAAKRGAIFISVGRGRSTDHGALIAALESGQLAGAGLDVTDPEPLPIESPLWQMSNVIITPHASGQPTVEASRRVGVLLVENLRRYVAGEPLFSVVDIERGY